MSEEEQLLRESVERFLERGYDFDTRKSLLADGSRYSAENWRQFAELGWLGLGIGEDDGGFGGGPDELRVLCEAFGRALVIEPFVSTAVFAARSISLAQAGELRSELLAGISDGQLRIAVAHAEAKGRYDLHHVDTRAVAQGNGFRISGAKAAVQDAPLADKLLVAARIGGESRDQNGIGLFLVEKDAARLQAKQYAQMDGTFAADLEFNETPAMLLVGPEDGYDVLEQAVQWTIAARCAQAVGSMDAGYQQTLEYLKTREQFGTRLGSFQALQHRMVDMLTAVRESQSMMRMVSRDAQSDDPTTRRMAVSGAKAFIGKRARAVGQEMVQLHGGVGMTEELTIGHFFRWLTLFANQLGSTQYHLQRYAALSQSSA